MEHVLLVTLLDIRESFSESLKLGGLNVLSLKASSEWQRSRARKKRYVDGRHMHLKPLIFKLCHSAVHQHCNDDTLQLTIILPLKGLLTIYQKPLVFVVPCRGVTGIGSLQSCI